MSVSDTDVAKNFLGVSKENNGVKQQEVIQPDQDISEGWHNEKQEVKDFLKAARQGDKEAFSEIWKKYERKLHYRVFPILKNKEDTEDALQEAAIKAYKGIGRFNGKSQIYTWLHTISTNTAKNIVKMRSTRPHGHYSDGVNSQNALEVGGGVPSTEEKALEDELWLELRRGIDKLPKGMKETFIRKEIEGVPVPEIAQEEGIPSGTVKSRSSRAGNEIKRIIDRYLEDEPEYSGPS